MDDPGFMRIPTRVAASRPAQPGLEPGIAAENDLRRRRLVDAAEAILLPRRCAAAPRLEVASDRLGVSPRALHHAFARVHGMSPARYLRQRRLDLVQEALLAEPGCRSAIKRAALAYGFRHLGHFSRAYRDRFGERPSDTIARALARAAGSPAHRAPRMPVPLVPDGIGVGACRRPSRAMAGGLRPPAAAARPAPPGP